MKNRVLYLVSLVAGVLMSAMPAYAISVGQDVTLVTLNGVSNVTMLANSAFDTLTVNTNGFTFTLSGSQKVYLRDSDAQIMTTNVDGVVYACGSGNSELTLLASKASSYDVEIKGFACSGGGGGGYSAPSTTTTTNTDTTSAVATPSTTTSTDSTASAQTTTPAPSITSVPSAVPYVPPSVVPPAQTPSLVQYSTMLNLTRGLGVGSTGEDVRSLQQALAAMPDVYPEGLVTGRYGSLTKAAIARFQMKYGIVSSESDVGYGYVGPKTRAKLQEVFSGGMSIPPMISTPPDSSVAPSQGMLTRALSLGDSGDDVIQLQAYLARDPELYPEAKVTGYYGPLTVAAVKRFQARYGISQVGRVGLQTMAKLHEMMGSGQNSAVSEEAALQTQIQQLQGMVSSLQSQIQMAQ